MVPFLDIGCCGSCHCKASKAPAAAMTSASTDVAVEDAPDEGVMPLLSNGLPPPLWSLEPICELLDDAAELVCVLGEALVSTTRPVVLVVAAEDVLVVDDSDDAPPNNGIEVLDARVELVIAAESVGTVVVEASVVALLVAIDCWLDTGPPYPAGVLLAANDADSAAYPDAAAAWAALPQSDSGPSPCRYWNRMLGPFSPSCPHACCTGPIMPTRALMQVVLHPADLKSSGVQPRITVVYMSSQAPVRISALLSPDRTKSENSTVCV
jgi:hypothetical protein